MQMPIHFDGATYEPSKDLTRLSTLMERVRAAMGKGQWWTLEELASHCQGSEASVSARLRDLRKERFGGHTIERVRRDRGLFIYRMTK